MWYLGVVVASISQRKFIHTEAFGIVGAPDSYDKSLKVGDFLKCKIVPWCRSNFNSRYAQWIKYKIDPCSWHIINAPVTTYVYSQGPRYLRAVFDVPITPLKNGLFYSEFFGTIKGNIESDAQFSLIMRRVEPREISRTSSAWVVCVKKLSLKLLFQGTNKDIIDLKNSLNNNIHGSANELRSIRLQRLTYRAGYQGDNVADKSAQQYCGVVVSDIPNTKRPANGPIIFIYNWQLGMVMAVPVSARDKLPKVGEWICFELMKYWSPPSDSSAKYRMKSFSWRTVDAPVPTCTTIHEEKELALLEIPVFKDDNGKLFSQFAGEIGGDSSPFPSGETTLVVIMAKYEKSKYGWDIYDKNKISETSDESESRTETDLSSTMDGELSNSQTSEKIDSDESTVLESSEEWQYRGEASHPTTFDDSVSFIPSSDNADYQNESKVSNPNEENQHMSGTDLSTTLECSLLNIRPSKWEDLNGHVVSESSDSEESQSQREVDHTATDDDFEVLKIHSLETSDSAEPDASEQMQFQREANHSSTDNDIEISKIPSSERTDSLQDLSSLCLCFDIVDCLNDDSIVNVVKEENSDLLDKLLCISHQLEM